MTRTVPRLPRRTSTSSSFSRPVPSSDDRLILEAHRVFHAALLARCPSLWARRLTSLLAEHSQRYLFLNAHYSEHVGESIAEHEQLLEATLTGDVEQAARVLVAHLQGSLGTVRAALEARQETQRIDLLNQENTR